MVSAIRIGRRLNENVVVTRRQAMGLVVGAVAAVGGSMELDEAIDRIRQEVSNPAHQQAAEAELMSRVQVARKEAREVALAAGDLSTPESRRVTWEAVRTAVRQAEEEVLRGITQ